VTISGLTSVLQQNAAKARTRGLEFDVYARVTEELTLSGGLSYMPTAKYLKYVGAAITSYNPATGAVTSTVGDVSGNRLIQAPKVQAQVQALYSKAYDFGDIDLAASLAYKSRIYFISDNRLSQDPVTLVNASAKFTLPGDKYSIAIWGKNLSDKEYFTDAVQSAGVDIIVPGSPRTYGVTLRAVF
jgi:iron complex outermembrane receptor protein